MKTLALLVQNLELLKEFSRLEVIFRYIAQNLAPMALAKLKFCLPN